MRLTQTALGTLVGVQKRTVLDWEKGRTSPSAAQLSALGEHGLDAMYVMTGQRGIGAGASEAVHMLREAGLREPGGAGKHHDLLNRAMQRRSEHYAARLDRLDPLIDRLSMCSDADFALIESMLARIFDGQPSGGSNA